MEKKTKELPKWYKPGIKASGAGCLCCPGTVEKLPLDTRIYQGFGGWMIKKDGEIFFMDETGRFDSAPKLSKFERIARKEPNSEWIAQLDLPLRSGVYQRHGNNSWVLIEQGLGFA